MNLNHVHPLLVNTIQTAPRTGSTVYGGGVIGADEDVLLHPSCSSLLKAVEDEQITLPPWAKGCLSRDCNEGYPDSEVITYRIAGTRYNLIYCKKEKTYDLWLLVTNTLVHLVNSDNTFKISMSNKKFRVGAFRALYLTMKDNELAFVI